MSPGRLWRILTGPLWLMYAKLFPVRYARRIGVRMAGRVHIFGSSFGMFGTEPFLVSLGDNVYITPGASFLTHDGGVLIARDRKPGLEIARPIRIGNNVFIGTMALIMPGVEIGNDCIIGARAVVTRNVPDGSVVAGHPARVIKSTEEYLRKAEQESLGIGHLTGREKVSPTIAFSAWMDARRAARIRPGRRIHRVPCHDAHRSFSVEVFVGYILFTLAVSFSGPVKYDEYDRLSVAIYIAAFLLVFSAGYHHGVRKPIARRGQYRPLPAAGS
ncbi:MAG: acyltransferase [Kiritimatiellia bacterium]